MLDAIFRGAFFKVLIMMMVFMLMLSMMLTQAQKKADATENANTGMIVTINWPNGDSDVDLWMDGPSEPVPVGYSNKGGRIINLLRDDLGNLNDPMDINYETAYVRGIVPGRYTVNVHCYRCAVTPLTVRAEVRVNQQDKLTKNVSYTKIFEGDVVLRQAGQERTVIEFMLNADGRAELDSFTSVYRPLRSANKSK